jgi:hypothetical protein
MVDTVAAITREMHEIERELAPLPPYVRGTHPLTLRHEEARERLYRALYPNLAPRR